MQNLARTIPAHTYSHLKPVEYLNTKNSTMIQGYLKIYIFRKLLERISSFGDFSWFWSGSGRSQLGFFEHRIDLEHKFSFLQFLHDLVDFGFKGCYLSGRQLGFPSLN